MYYCGYFRNNDKEEHLYKVVIITNFNKEEFAYGGTITLSDEPFVVNYESESDNIFKPYKCSTATVGILQTEYNFEFNNATGNNVLVMLLKLKDNREDDFVIADEDNRHLRKDNYLYNVEWIGFATPNSYSQEYENYLDSFELECQDAISTFQFYKYKMRNDFTTYISFIDIIKRYCTQTRTYKHIYISDTLILPTLENGDIFNFCYVDQRNFFNEDGEAKTVLEVIEQLCLYLNLTLIPFGNSLYVVDYNGIKEGINSYFHYSYQLDDGICFCAKNATDIDFYKLEDEKVIFEHSVDIKEKDFSATGTKLTLGGVFNKVTVKDSLYGFDTISPDFDNVNRWGKSNYYDTPGAYDAYNIIIQSDNKFISEYTTNYSLVKWCENGFDTKARIDEDRQLSVFGNIRKSDTKQKCFIKFLDFKESDSIFNNSELETFWYNQDFKDTEGYWHFGDRNNTINEEKNYCYNTLRNYCGAQLIAYETVTVDENELGEHPKKLELKPAILISTPSTLTYDDYVGTKNVFLNGYIQPMFKVRTKSVCFGSGDYFVITWKQRFSKFNDVLPYNFTAIDSIDKECNQLIGLKFNNIDYFFNGEDWIRSEDNFAFPYYFIEGNAKNDKKAFETDLEIPNNYNFKDKLGVENGIVIPALKCDTENGVNVGEIEFTFYRPFGANKSIPVKSTLITDLEIKLVTKSEINHYNSSDDDTDTEYSNVIDNGSIEEKSSIDLDISTWDNKQPNYSSIIYSDTVNRTGQAATSNDGLRRIKHIFNRATGDLMRAEELIIMNNINQYSTPTVSLNLNLHIQPLPYSTFTYHLFKDKLFIVDSAEYDYRNNSYNITITEKK